MSNYYYGNVHTFTNRQEGGTIIIRPGRGETLSIESASYTAPGSDTQVIFNDGGVLNGDAGLVYDKDTNTLQATNIVAPGDSVNNTQIIFNDAGILASDGGLIYNKTSNTLSTDYITGQFGSDNAGYNELSDLQTLQHTSTTLARSQGTSIAVTQTGTNYILAGAPYFPTEGRSVLFSATAGADQIFSQYATPLAIASITSASYTGIYCDIDSDGSRAIFTDGAEISNTVIYKNTAGVWALDSPDSIPFSRASKLSGNYIVSAYNNDSADIYFYDGAWNSQHTLNAAGAGTNLYSVFEIDNGDLVAWNDPSNFLHIYTRASTTWTDVQNFDHSTDPLLNININSTVMVANGSSHLYIYERAADDKDSPFSLSIIINKSNCLACCTNGTYIFLLTNAAIHIYHKVSGTWTESVNTTTLTLGTCISCNDNYVTVGRPTANTNLGNIYVYDINVYTDTILNVSTISLNQNYPDLNISVLDGDVNILNNTNITGNLDSTTLTTTTATITTGNITTGNITTNNVTTGNIGTANISSKILNSLGSNTAPSYSFTGDTNTGLYSSAADVINVAVGGVNTLQINAPASGLFTSKILALSDVAGPGKPEYGFSLDSDTGMYCDTVGTLSFGTAGTKKLDISTVITPAVQIQNINGDATSPSYSFANSTNTGLYYSADTLNIGIAGTRHIQIWDDDLNVTASRSRVSIDKADASSNVANNVGLSIGCGNSKAGIELVSESASLHYLQYFYSSSTTLAGSISVNGATTNFNISSDIRLKKDFINLESVAEDINKIKIYEYTLKESGTRHVGVIAHELNEVFPKVVTLAKDIKPDIQEDDLSVCDQVNYIGLVPYLIKNIQELNKTVENLILRINTLENEKV